MKELPQMTARVRNMAHVWGSLVEWVVGWAWGIGRFTCSSMLEHPRLGTEPVTVQPPWRRATIGR